MINKAILVGNLGKDPEVRYTPSGKARATFSIATSRRWKDRESGEMREHTDWHNIVAWGRLGEICGEYLSKGKQVYIEGRIQTRSYEKDGVTHYITEIEALEMKMLGTKDAGNAYRPPGGGDAAPEYSGPPLPEDNDSDIPF